MKNIEKMAIDALLKTLSETKTSEINDLNAAKKAFDDAKKSFQTIANNIMKDVKIVANDIVEELTDEAVQYFESEITNKLGVPFKLK